MRTERLRFGLRLVAANGRPDGAEEPTAESAGLRRRKDLSTSGLFADRARAPNVLLACRF